jgi:hypothetical protein
MNRVCPETWKLIVESTYLQAQQTLQEVLALGVTYDDLIAEGMHPAFLNQVFARINAPSPRISSRAVSVPQSIATPDILPTPQLPQTSTPTIPVPLEVPARITPLEVDVDNFLDALEPEIKNRNGNDESKKRDHLLDRHHHHPPKRRAFGLTSPRQLVIDVSDDDSDSDDSDDDEKDDAPQEPITIQKPRAIKIPERPQLTQQVLPT